ncbi:MAG: FHA domain-containing protein [Terracidiphilus sp.]|jgi:ABC-type multidrug transport system ATPase subunit/pSer/pThr/pTyr-binding forkhead associated (FHA) protein/ABC-type multidrug transport system permease subunit
MFQNDSGPQTSWVIGRETGCDLMVPESAVSSRHCRLTHHANGFTVEDLNSTNGTFVNGVKIAPGEPVWVAHGARITLGSRIEMPWPVAPNNPSGREETIHSAFESSARAGQRQITIGRSPDSDVQIDLPIIGWNHAVITVQNGQYILEDRNSRNGTAIGQLGNRIQRAVLDPSSDVYLGSYKVAAAQLISGGKKVEIGEAAFHKVNFRGNTMEIGRDPQSDVPLQFPMVSWRHARLTRSPGGILVEDLGSRNGTYVDGVRIGAKVLVKPGQEIGLGSFRFQLLEGGELAQREYYGNVTIEANGIVVHAPNGKRLLNAVSLTVFPSELVALMGPAGAGKTTLLKALNGYTRPVEGMVLFNGSSLYDYYDRFRQQMGYVPQDDIVHPQLTVRQALYFSARLRTDLTDAEIDARTEKVLDDLGIPDKIDTVIGSPERKTLSGGQRKRVNIALELITDTPVLFLDEPTSGLSSYDAESVVDLLKSLSKTGKTIVTTIHQPSLKVYKQFDDLLMVSRDKGDSPGALVYFGPAYPDSIQFFNPPAVNAQPAASSPAAQPELNPEMLFSGMNTVPEANRTETWRKRYEASRYQKEFAAGRSGKQPAARGKTGEESPRRQFGFKQWLALVKRNVIVKLQDRAQTAILLMQAPFFAILVCVIASPLDKNDPAGLAEKLPIAHFLMVVAAIWFGCNNAARDIVGEWTIYRRERMVTLKLVPYIFSKLAVLLALCTFQCGVMLGIVYLVCGLHGNFVSGFLVLLMASMIGAGLGLCVSAVSKTNESAIALLPVVLLPIIALGGGMRPIYVMPKVGQAISLAIPSRWAFEANLVDEATADAWKPAADANPQPNPQPAGSPKPAAPNACAANPPVPAAGVRPQPSQPRDPAERAFPRYIVTKGSDKVRPALESEYPEKDPASNAVPFRHEFRGLMAVLTAMLVLTVGAVIVILRRRDNDPQ